MLCNPVWIWFLDVQMFNEGIVLVVCALIKRVILFNH